MRIAFVFGGIPDLRHAGSTIAAWAIVEEFLAAGHDVTAVLLPEAEFVNERAPEQLAALERLGVTVRVVEIPPVSVCSGRWRRRLAFARSLARPRDDELFPSARAAEAVRAALEETAPGAGLAFGFEAAAATAALGRPPLLVALSHPPGVPRRLRFRYAGRRRRGVVWRVSELSFLAYADRRAAALLSRFPSVAMFSRHYTHWARSRGVNAWHAHLPIPDLAGPSWRERRAGAARGPRPRILMIGHLRGTATVAGLRLFVCSILPLLTQALGPDGFEVHLVGRYEPPEELAAGLRHPAVRLRGHVLDAADEFLAAQVLLVPNPTSVGGSARILTGLSFGSCIVAHTDMLIGTPELAHGENCLLVGDGRALAYETLRALADAALRDRLGANGRALYERTFKPEVAARRLVREVERLAPKRAG